MPNRIIREGWVESENINTLTDKAELFFLRLCLKADDFGRFHANPLLLKSNLYPLRESVRVTDLPRWLAECEKSGLVRCYEHSGKRYVEIVKFNQRTRAEKSKFPEPSEGKILPCQSNDGQVTVSGQAAAHVVGDGDVVGDDSRAKPISPQLSDSDWLVVLQESEAYRDLNVKVEFDRMIHWCSAKRKRPTRARFLNWLNRSDKPMKGRAQPELPVFRAPRREP